MSAQAVDVTADAPLLDVRDLKTHFHTRAGIVKAVDGVSFTLRPGEVLGLVGESGSGKSVTGSSILGLVDPPGRIVAGSVWFEGRDLAKLSPEELRTIRGRRISMVFQDATATLNPVLSIGAQMGLAVRAHERIGGAALRRRCVEGLAQVGIPDPASRLDAFPHQLSGGMRALVRTSGTAMIWITHDLATVSGLSDHLIVMYAGKVVEAGPTRPVLRDPRHPYTQGLLDSVPSRNPPGVDLPQVQGQMPSPLRLPPGCPFQPRCPRASAVCVEMPGTAREGERGYRCHHPVGLAA